MNRYAKDLFTLCNVTCLEEGFADKLRGGEFNPFTNPAIQSSDEVREYNIALRGRT